MFVCVAFYENGSAYFKVKEKFEKQCKEQGKKPCYHQFDANDFPLLQVEKVRQLVSLYNSSKADSSLLVWTNSPYFYTILNNLMYAYDLANDRKKRKGLREKVNEVIPERYWINFDEVRAYFVSGDTVTDMLDNEIRLINAEPLDTTSDTIMDEFDLLYKMKWNDDEKTKNMGFING